ncbi:hypothetical protein DERP_013886 [Dermatophagoides pteronyssinus]|uniref:Uncharacterized protein n=1 Tax=Dermatophagoides pteronyssinus TaxID=6956 RepID=A0ABQ8J2X7_DERPT|nr:hypothetical protein DERP_013886 [Dermatophagoides pteronyssinus]
MAKLISEEEEVEEKKCKLTNFAHDSVSIYLMDVDDLGHACSRRTSWIIRKYHRILDWIGFFFGLKGIRCIY